VGFTTLKGGRLLAKPEATRWLGQITQFSPTFLTYNLYDLNFVSGLAAEQPAGHYQISKATIDERAFVDYLD
jgi:hypothetical protein